MVHTLTMWAFAIVLVSIFSTTSAHLLPLNLERREICVENTIYLALQEFIYDADPWCRTELGILDIPSTVATLTGRTTTTFTQTTTSTKVETITVPSSTVTVTGSPSFAVIPLEKRNPVPATAAFQSLSFIQSINDGSASEALYADVIAACKCLHLEPRIDYIIASASVARTVRAVDYRKTTQYVTVTAGVATEFKTPSNITFVPTGLPVKPASTSLEIVLPIEPVTSVASSNLSLISQTATPLTPKTLVGTGLSGKPASTSLEITLPIEPVSSVASSNLSLTSLTATLLAPTTLVGTGRPSSDSSTRVLPSNGVLTITVSPIPSIKSNLTRLVSISSIRGTGVSPSIVTLEVTPLPSINISLVTPTSRTPTFENSTLVTLAPSVSLNTTLATIVPSISLNTTYILPLPSRPTTSAPLSNATGVVDSDLLIRNPQLPALCQSLFSSRVNPVKTVLSTIVSTSVRTDLRTSVTTSIITSYVTSIKTAIITQSLPTDVVP